MKTIKKTNTNDLKKEYDFSKFKGGVRGKYAKKYTEGTNIVLLDPDIAKVFPTDKDVNDALRVIIKAAKLNYKGTSATKQL